MPEWDNPFVVLKDGKPFLTGGSVGFGYWEASLQALVNVLDFGLDPKAAVEKPQIRKNWPVEETLAATVRRRRVSRRDSGRRARDGFEYGDRFRS